MAHAAASIAVRDGVVGSLGVRLDSQRQRAAIRYVVIAVIVVSYVLAVLYKGDLIWLLLWAYGPVGQFAPAIVATLYWKRATGAGVLAGLFGGAAVTILINAFPVLKFFPLHAGIYGVAVNVALLILVSMSTRSGAPGRDTDFLRIAAG